MIVNQQPQHELQYRPQAAKTLRHQLMGFIAREFPRLGGPWIIERFVDKMLSLVDAYRTVRERLRPGQTLWSAVAVDERPGRNKPMSETRQVPVIVAIAGQEQVADLRAGDHQREVLKRALVRAAFDAYAQGGVLTTTDLAVLLHRPYSTVADLIRAYEAETGEVVPRRGNVHDIGRTVTHKRIICRKAYLEGKTTPVIARETCHSPEAVDAYVLDYARIYFASVERGMSLDELVFAVQRPRHLVEEYLRLIAEFGLAKERVYERCAVDLLRPDGHITEDDEDVIA
jgi:hypothetical protein